MRELDGHRAPDGQRALDGRAPAPRASPENRALALVLVDSEQAMAEALAAVLARHPSVSATRAVSDPAEAMAAITAAPVDVLVLGTDPADWDPLTFLRSVSRLRPELPVMAISLDDDPEHVTRTLLAGAASWVSKRTPIEDMAAALIASAHGESSVPPSILRDVLRRLRDNADAPAQGGVLRTLTEREREVLEYAVLGFSRNAIAADLGLSVNTVRTHLQHVMAKLGVHTTLEAVSLFLRERARP